VPDVWWSWQHNYLVSLFWQRLVYISAWVSHRVNHCPSFQCIIVTLFSSLYSPLASCLPGSPLAQALLSLVLKWIRHVTPSAAFPVANVGYTPQPPRRAHHVCLFHWQWHLSFLMLQLKFSRLSAMARRGHVQRTWIPVLSLWFLMVCSICFEFHLSTT
jgi:hypothetical protein